MNRGVGTIQTIIVIGLVIILLAVLTVVMRPQTSSVESNNVGGSAEVNESGYQSEVLAGDSSPLLEFNEVDYQEALKSDKLIVLYFFANWCPSCKIELRSTRAAFDELTRDDVIGFRVNYNDSQTSAAERSLASEFGVAYQHTKVFVRNEERLLKSPETWQKDRYLSEINNVLE